MLMRCPLYQLGRFAHRSILQRLAPSPTLCVAPNLGTSLRRRNSSSHLEQPTGFLMLNFPIESCSCVACSFRLAMTHGCERRYRIDASAYRCTSSASQYSYLGVKVLMFLCYMQGMLLDVTPDGVKKKDPWMPRVAVERKCDRSVAPWLAHVAASHRILFCQFPRFPPNVSSLQEQGTCRLHEQQVWSISPAVLCSLPSSF